MSAISDRYDRAAERYGIWWAPVLQATAVRVLDRLAPELPRGTDGLRILDIGTGTGTLALEAVRRWPHVAVSAADASRGMIAAAQGRANRTLTRPELDRLALAVGEADRLPYDNATFDAAISSFVFQLVPDRMAAFEEAHRVMRPGGTFAFVTWMVSSRSFPPDEAFFDVVDELEIPDEESAPEDRSGDFVSARSAADQLRRAGFKSVRSREETLEYQFDPARYVDFLEQYGEYDLFRSLDRRLRGRLRERSSERLATLPRSAFTWQAPVVMVVARRP
jgi:ubiquinone/menaquinone biosynthesis C-methylase UbiE